MFVDILKPRPINRLALCFILLLTVGIYCEYLIYYVHFIGFCGWPASNAAQNVTTRPNKILVLSDPHLLGRIRGHWFDKLRREWQMYRSFQSALQLFRPEFVFILGDIFDEGQIARPEDFDVYVRRFETIFSVPESTRLYVVVGNHDIGFHYRTDKLLYSRFDQRMNTSVLDSFELNQNILVIRLNSIAMEADGCSLCQRALNRIEELSRNIRRKSYSQIVLLTHFPLYRADESECSEPDSATESERFVPHREGFDCLTREASAHLLDRLRPTLILNGHVHSGCKKLRTMVNFRGQEVVSQEVTVASFSWRNRLDPNFLLLSVGEDSLQFTKCFVPHEHLVFGIYGFGFLICFSILCSLLFSRPVRYLSLLITPSSLSTSKATPLSSSSAATPLSNKKSN